MSDAVIRRTRPTARIPHRCDQCGRTIDPGERYDNQFYVCDDHPHTWRTCAHCTQLIGDLAAYDTDFWQDREDGAYLPDEDWRDIARWSVLWAQRAVLYRCGWRHGDGSLSDYPAETT